MNAPPTDLGEEVIGWLLLGGGWLVGVLPLLWADSAGGAGGRGGGVVNYSAAIRTDKGLAW